MVSDVDAPYWVSVVGFTGWFLALGGFSLLVLFGFSFLLRRLEGDALDPAKRKPPAR
ncbi:MAG: hypothetical protein ACOYEF_01630 [Planifilum sp.]